MKKLLCYLAIIILISFIAVPPLLRAFYNDDNKQPVIIDKFELMTCKKDDYIISSSYKNSEIVNIRFAYYEEKLNIETDDDEKMFELIIARSLKNDTKTNLDIKEDDQIIYTLKIDEATGKTLEELEEYRLKIDEQKTLYEANEYTCNIIEG